MLFAISEKKKTCAGSQSHKQRHSRGGKRLTNDNDLNSAVERIFRKIKVDKDVRIVGAVESGLAFDLDG